MISNLAYIHPKAQLGKDITVEPFTTIGEDVVIGDGTWIGPNVTIMNGARIGKNNRIFPGSVIAAIPQDLKFVGEYTTLELGENNTIRECCTLNRGTASKGKTVLGNNNLLMAYSHVAHDCVVQDYCILGNSTQLAGEVMIEDWVIISGLTGVHQFSKVGTHSFVAPSSVVRQDIPPYVKTGHEPLSYIGINSVGLKRRGFTAEKLSLIQDCYRIVFLLGLNTKNALAKIEEEIEQCVERDIIVEFIRASERGIIKGYKGNNNHD